MKEVSDIIAAHIEDSILEMTSGQKLVTDSGKEPPNVGDAVYGVVTPCGSCPFYDEENDCKSCDKACVAKFYYDESLESEWGKRVFKTESEAETVCERMKSIEK